MRITFGCTRIVFIFDGYVIKIPRIRIFHLLSRFFEHSTNKKVGTELKKFGPTFFTATVRYFFSGFYANRIEYTYSQNTSSDGIVPTRAILWGIILIQQRGEVLTQSDKRWVKLRRGIQQFGIKERDTIRSCNYCIINGHIRMLDYGCEETVIGLDAINLKIVERFGRL